MPTFARACDVYQGYNFKKDKQSTVGFLLSIKIGDTTLTADQTCKDPTAPTTDVKCVAVLNHFLWETGVTDAIYFSGQVTVTNKQSVSLLTYTDLSKVEAVFQFSVYEYDPAAKVYYLSCHSNSTDMKGIIEKNGSELNLSVADDPSTEVQSPLNFAFQVGIKPQPSAQNINLATSQSGKIVKSWGLAVG